MSQITGEKVALRLKEPGRCRLLYEILLAGRAIGEVELDHIAWRSREAELEIAIFDPDRQSRGYGTDAVTTLLTHVFSTMGLRRVYLRVHAANAMAIRCYEKAGFRKKGRLQRCLEGNAAEEILLMSIDREQFGVDSQSQVV